MSNKKILFGLIERHRYSHYDQCLKILGITIFKKYYNNGFPYIRIFGLKFKIDPVTRIKYSINKILNNSNHDINDIFVLFNNSGETSLFLATVRDYFQSKKDNLLIVATRQYHLQLLEIFLPEIPKVFIPELNSVHLDKNVPDHITITNTHVHIVAKCKYFIEYEKSLRNVDNFSNIEHFYERYCRHFVPNNDCIATYPTIPDWALEEKRKKIRSLKINTPFVFICNETYSNINFSDSFYQLLTKECQRLGFDVVFNSMHLSSANMYGHTTVLSFAEAMAFAAEAYCVIGIRSGLLDVITPFSNRIIALYTPFRDRGDGLPLLEADILQVAFTLKKLPNQGKKDIDEIIIKSTQFNNGMTNEMEVMNKILQILKKK